MNIGRKTTFLSLHCQTWHYLSINQFYLKVAGLTGFIQRFMIMTASHLANRKELGRAIQNETSIGRREAFSKEWVVLDKVNFLW